MNNLHKFAALSLMVGIWAAPSIFMSDSAQAQDYPKAGQYYPKGGNYPRAAGKSAPQAAPTQSSTVQNSTDDSAVVSGRKDAVRVRKAGVKAEDQTYYDRYQNTMEAWNTIRNEIGGGQRDITTYDSEVLMKNHRNVALLWCKLHKDFKKTVERVSDGKTTIEDKTVQDIRNWLGCLYDVVNSFESELKSRGLEFDSYEKIKKEQGIKED